MFTHRRKLMNKPEKVYSTKVSDDTILALSSMYKLKDLQKHIKIPNYLLPTIIEEEGKPKVKYKGIPLNKAEALLHIGWTPKELTKRFIINPIDFSYLEKLHLKLNEKDVNAQVYCVDKKEHQLKWVVNRNERMFSRDTLAFEIQGIFQSNNNLINFNY